MSSTEQEATTKTRVLLVDDHVIVRDSLARRLEDEPDEVRICAVASLLGRVGQEVVLTAAAPANAIVEVGTKRRAQVALRGPPALTVGGGAG